MDHSPALAPPSSQASSKELNCHQTATAVSEEEHVVGELAELRLALKLAHLDCMTDQFRPCLHSLVAESCLFRTQIDP